jgi:hypothetical protein
VVPGADAAGGEGVVPGADSSAETTTVLELASFDVSSFVHAVATRATTPTMRRRFHMESIQPQETAYGGGEPMKSR